MRVQVVIARQAATVEVSRKTGNKYAQQAVGVLFPGDDFPIADRMLVNVKPDGSADAYPTGTYFADAQVTRGQNDFLVRVDYRTIKPAAASAAPKAV